MLEFRKTIDRLNEIIKSTHGAKPTVEVCFIDETITVKKAPSGTIKIIANAKDICCHLTQNGLEIKFFNR
jgi:hypothetical protein